MKISIITACFNSQDTIKDTLESVMTQSYDNVEHIIIDGGSTDNTLNIINQYIDGIDLLITEKDDGIYDAMNKGIDNSSGDIIAILNSDDIYADNFVLENIVKCFLNTKANIVFGDLVYFKNNEKNTVTRFYSSSGFRSWKLRFGWMPPHPATFFHKSVHRKFGLYSTDYRTGADYEMFVRLLLKHNLPFVYVNKILIKMRIGGATSSGIRSVITTSSEMVKAIRANGFYTNIVLIYLRLPLKFLETLR